MHSRSSHERCAILPRHRRERRRRSGPRLAPLSPRWPGRAPAPCTRRTCAGVDDARGDRSTPRVPAAHRGVFTATSTWREPSTTPPNVSPPSSMTVPAHHATCATPNNARAQKRFKIRPETLLPSRARSTWLHPRLGPQERRQHVHAPVVERPQALLRGTDVDAHARRHHVPHSNHTPAPASAPPASLACAPPPAPRPRLDDTRETRGPAHAPRSQYGYAFPQRRARAAPPIRLRIPTRRARAAPPIRICIPPAPRARCAADTDMHSPSPRHAFAHLDHKRLWSVGRHSGRHELDVRIRVPPVLRAPTPPPRAA